MVSQADDILSQLTPLKPLDLKQCKTVSDIAAGMERCSFGARMLGQVAAKLTAWTTSEPQAIIIYDGKPEIYDGEPDPAGRLHRLLRFLCTGKKRWFKRLYTPQGFLNTGKHVEHALVVGPVPERIAAQVYARIHGAVFVNNHNQCKPGQVRDGYFPDVVFADPRVILPILYCVIDERRNNERHSITDLIADLPRYGGAAHELVRGAKTLASMLEDKACTVMLTLSGAMTVAKMQPLVVDLIETDRIAYISSTGALMAHGLIEGSGCVHYKYDPRLTDEQLAEATLNRVTDTLEPETNFDHIEPIVTAVLGSFPGGAVISSHEFHRALGAYLAEHFPGQRAILRSAYEHNVPIVTPAFTDSEMANDVFCFNALRSRDSRHRIHFDLERDTSLLFQLATRAKRLGIFTIGGGVPRNHTQNVACLTEIYGARVNPALHPCIFEYGCRIDPASMALGHLSGCTYQEGGTWRKFAFDGMFAEVRMDATIAWPFIQKYAFESMGL
jgi:deoxyhypusine synthase